MTAAPSRFKIWNLDRVGTLPGGVGHPHDRAVVLDLDTMVPHILTGEPQHATVYRGDLAGAHAFVRTVSR